MCNTIYNFSRYFQNILSLNELNNSSIFICIQFHLLEIIFQTISNEIDSDSKRKSKFLKNHQPKQKTHKAQPCQPVSTSTCASQRDESVAMATRGEATLHPARGGGATSKSVHQWHDRNKLVRVRQTASRDALPLAPTLTVLHVGVPFCRVHLKWPQRRLHINARNPNKWRTTDRDRIGGRHECVNQFGVLIVFN